MLSKYSTYLIWKCYTWAASIHGFGIAEIGLLLARGDIVGKAPDAEVLQDSGDLGADVVVGPLLPEPIDGSTGCLPDVSFGGRKREVG